MIAKDIDGKDLFPGVRLSLLTPLPDPLPYGGEGRVRGMFPVN